MEAPARVAPQTFLHPTDHNQSDTNHRSPTNHERHPQGGSSFEPLVASSGRALGWGSLDTRSTKKPNQHVLLSSIRVTSGSPDPELDCLKGCTTGRDYFA